MQLPPSDRPVAPKRTLAELNDDYLSFASEGELKSKNQSAYYNTINPALLHIEPEFYCVPYLHILLGITKKHHELQEMACHNLDIEIAIDAAKNNTEIGHAHFDKYIKGQKELNKLQTKKHNLEDRLHDMHHDSDDLSLAQIATNMKRKDKLCERIAALDTKIISLKAKLNLEPGSGPLSNNMEKTLQNHNIQRQKYHGKSFVGNDCHKYLSIWVYSDICENIARKTMELTDNANIVQKAQHVSKRFRKLWQLYSAVHNKISHSKFIEDDNIPLIHQAITQYCEYFRQEFPDVRFSLKQHLLEEHAMPWLLKYQ